MSTPEIDLSGFNQHADAFFTETHHVLEAASRKLVDAISQRTHGHIDPKGPETGTRSTSKRVGNQSGALSSALLPDHPGNILHQEITTDGLHLEFGIDTHLVPYARVQEQGGTITPKEAKALTIPVSEEAVKALESAGGDIRSLDLVVIAGSGKTPVLAKKDGYSLDVWFVLAPSVMIEPRPFWGPGLDDVERIDLPRIAEELALDLAHVWNTL